MKKFFGFLILALSLGTFIFSSCEEEDLTYQGPALAAFERSPIIISGQSETGMPETVRNSDTAKLVVQMVAAHQPKGMTFKYRVVPSTDSISIKNNSGTLDWYRTNAKEGEHYNFISEKETGVINKDSSSTEIQIKTIALTTDTFRILCLELLEGGDLKPAENYKKFVLKIK